MIQVSEFIHVVQISQDQLLGQASEFSRKLASPTDPFFRSDVFLSTPTYKCMSKASTEQMEM